MWRSCWWPINAIWWATRQINLPSPNSLFSLLQPRQERTSTKCSLSSRSPFFPRLVLARSTLKM
jgi:hypothetical protein